MRSNYKRLGDYIKRCDEFNDGMQVKELLGISNNKYFQASHTNTIGIDLSTYRVVRTNQFAFNRATTRNGDKISIALRQGNDCIVSPSYRIFQVIDEDILNSEYLMMWFRRPEFDRYARFKSHGSAHEFFDWEEMCEVELPVPSIEKQREIVKEYNTIVNRIKLNEQLRQKLEETAQTLYKHWFVDFEFPNENGKPYKSSGGAMEFNEELKQEIPKGWTKTKMDDLYDFQYGLGNNNPDNGGIYPVYGSNGVIGGYHLYNNEDAPVIGHIGANCGAVVFASGKHYVTYNGVMCNIKNGYNKYFGYLVLLNKDLKSQTRGSSQPFISYDMLYEIDIILPSKDYNTTIENTLNPIFDTILGLQKQIFNLHSLNNILLSKLATIEN